MFRGYVDFLYGSWSSKGLGSSDLVFHWIGVFLRMDWFFFEWISLSLDGWSFIRILVLHRIIGSSLDGSVFLRMDSLSMDGFGLSSGGIQIGSKNGYDQGFLRILFGSFSGSGSVFSGFSSCFSSDRIHILVSTEEESVTGNFNFFINIL